MQKKSAIVQKAMNLATLMSLATEIGATAQIRASNEVYLVGPGDTAPRLIGKSINEAVNMLQAMIGGASVAQLDGVSA